MRTLIPTKIAIYVFAAVMAFFGIQHFLYADMMTSAVPTFMPMPIVWVYFTGIAMILYAVSVFTANKYAKLAGYLLALMLVLFALTIHLASMATNPMAIIFALKDICLAMCAVIIANQSGE